MAEGLQAPTLIPLGATTDTLNNVAPPVVQTPTAGVDTLGSDQDTGKATIGDLPSAQALSSFVPQAKSPFVQKMADGTNAAATAAPAAASAPGGWARTLLAGALHALGGAGKVAETAGNVVGNLATGGTLAAVQGVARKQKQQIFNNQQEANKNQVLMAESNARMIHEQKLIHQMGEEEINQSIASGVQAADKLKTGASPAPVIADGLTSDELKQYLASNKIDPTKETAFPTGRKVVGQNPDGTPIYRTTYTALGVPPEVRLNPEDPKDKQILDDMNKYAPPSQGKWGTTGEQAMTGQQYNWVMQQVADNRAKTMARDKTLVDQKMEDKDNERKLEAVTFGGADWTNALAQAPNHDPIAARNAILANPQVSAKYPNLDSDLRFVYGDKNYDSMLDAYQKKIDSGLEQITDLQKTLDKAHGEDAASMAEAFQAKISDPNTPPQLKVRYAKMRDQANAQARASSKYTTDQKAAEADAEQRASEGDLTSLQDMVQNYQYDPDKLFSRFKGMKEKQDFIAKMHEQDPSWSEAQYKERYNTVNDFRPEGKGGQAVQSLNTFAGHVGDANSLISTLQNTRSPLLNTPLNKIDEQVLGQPQFVAYKAAVSAAADEYINFLLNQKAKHQSDDDLAAKLTSTSISPGMAQSLFRQMATTVAIRARALNKNYRDAMGGKDIPNYLDPDTQQVLKTFGIDPASITATGQSGLIKNPPATTKAPPPNAKNAVKDTNGNIIGYN